MTNPRNGGPPLVHNIRIEGNRALSDDDIEGKILTTETSWLPWTDRKYFDANSWQSDLRRIERFYQAEGYYQAEVTRDEVLPRANNEVDLRAYVAEGKPTHVTDIRIVGLEKLPPEFQKLALAHLPIKKGDVFRESEWEGVKGQVEAELKELGYAEALVAGDVLVETTNQTALLSLFVAPGIRYRFGNIYVVNSYHPNVKPKTIIQQAEGAIVRGRFYSTSAMTEAQTRVFNMGVFGAVKVTPAKPNPATATLPVVVDVREAPFHSVRVGPGFGFDPVRQELRATAEYTDRNFFGDLRKLTLRAHAGYAFLPSVSAALSSGTEAVQQGPIFDVLTELEQPHFLARDIKLVGSLEGARGLEQAYKFLSGKAKVGVIWQPHPAFSIYPSYNFEADRLDGLSSVPGQGAPTLALGCPRQPCILLLSYLEQTVEWDRRDDKYEPTRGYYLALSLQEGGGLLGGDFSYLRILPDARYYVSPTSKWTVASRVRAGTLLTAPGVESPIVSRFYSGGNSMRGFGTRRLSPLLAVPTVITDARAPGGIRGQPVDNVLTPLGEPREAGQTVAVGGNGLLEASLEIRYALLGPLVVAAFMDVGLVTECRFGARPVHATRLVNGVPTDELRCVNDTNFVGANLQYAVGVGVRYKTIVPIRLDLAYRLNIGPPLPIRQLQGTDVVYPQQGTCFGIADKGQRIAGSPEGPCSFQLSIGEAF